MSVPIFFRLVTLDEAKDQLSIPLTDTTEDSRIDRLVIDASQIIMDYLSDSIALGGWCDTSGHPFVDAQGNPERTGIHYDTSGAATDEGISIVPGPVRKACFLVIANLDAKRGEDDGNNPISVGVQSLLARYFLPAVG